MGDRATLEKIYDIMRRLLLVKLDGLNPIPRKGTTRRECYRALYEIQELLETRRYFRKHLPQTKADRIRSMTDEDLAEWIFDRVKCQNCHMLPCVKHGEDGTRNCKELWIAWLKEEATDEH